MMANFQDVLDMAVELEFAPEPGSINYDDQTFRVSDEARGVSNLVIDVDDPILILQQAIMPDPEDPVFYKRLLQVNAETVHGGYAALEEAGVIVWRDTLQVENLDLNELRGSLTALSLAMDEHAEMFIAAAQA